MKYSKEDKEEWRDRYKSGENVPSISEELDVPASTIYNHLQNSSVETRSPQRKYNVNDNFFEKIDNEIKSYWLGMITADGCVQDRGEGNRQKQLSLGLQIRDRWHIKKFKYHIEAENPIIYNSSSTLSSISINSNKLCNDLIDKGVGQNKTKTVRQYEYLDSSLRRHYWRGLIDGDGHVGYTKNRHGNYKPLIEFYGNKKMVSSFTNYVKEFCNTEANYRKRDWGLYTISFSNNIAKKVSDRLYKDSSIYLDRKYHKYKSYE